MEKEERAEGIRDFWRRFATAFAAPLRANGELSGFVTNPAVTGAYAESWVRELATSMACGFRISTGTVIRTTDKLQKKDLRRLPQADLIIWDPTELPALFESADFALVHTSAVRAIVEIKRTVSDIEAFRRQLGRLRGRLLAPYKRNVLGVVVAHRQSLFTGRLQPDWPAEVDVKDPVQVTRLLGKASSTPDPDGVFALIYFLSSVARSVRVGAA